MHNDSSKQNNELVDELEKELNINTSSTGVDSSPPPTIVYKQEIREFSITPRELGNMYKMIEKGWDSVVFSLKEVAQTPKDVAFLEIQGISHDRVVGIIGKLDITPDPLPLYLNTIQKLEVEYPYKIKCKAKLLKEAIYNAKKGEVFPKKTASIHIKMRCTSEGELLLNMSLYNGTMPPIEKPFIVDDGFRIERLKLNEKIEQFTWDWYFSLDWTLRFINDPYDDVEIWLDYERPLIFKINNISIFIAPKGTGDKDDD